MFKTKNEKIRQFFKDNLADSLDAKYQELSLQGQKVELIYITSICDVDNVQQLLVKPFFELSDPRKFEGYVKSLEAYKEYTTEDDAIKEVLRGGLVLLGPHSVSIVSLKKYVSQGVKDASVETTIQGPQQP